MRGAFRPAQEDMRSAIMLILTKDDEGLPGQWMERISDGEFRDRNRGIMNPLPMPAVNEQPRSCRSPRRQN